MSEFLEAMSVHFADMEGDDNSLLMDEAGNIIDEPSNPDNTANDAQLTKLMALESLVTGGGLVSQSMAYDFKDLLPRSAPLASFTHLPTKVNYGIAVESLGGAIKLVAIAGAVALIGGVGFLVYKIIKRRKLMPKNDLDKKVSAAFASIEEKLKVGIQELQTMHPDVKHPVMNWTRLEAVVRVSERRGVTECQAEILNGKYPFMSDKLYGIAAEQGTQICVFLETQFVKQVEQLTKMGTEDDITALDQALNSFSVTSAADDELREYCKSLGLTVGPEDSSLHIWQQKYGVRLENTVIKERIGSVVPNFKPMGDQGLKKLLIVQERMAKVFARLDKATKALEGKKGEVGGNYTTKLKELVTKAKEPLGILADVFGVSDNEVQAYNNCTRIKAEAITDGFTYVSDQYADLEKTDKGNAVAYKDCQAHLRKLFSNVKEAIK